MGDNSIPGDVSNLPYLKELENAQSRIKQNSAKEKNNNQYKEKFHQYLVDLFNAEFISGFIGENKCSYDKVLEMFVFHNEYWKHKKVGFEAFSSKHKNNKIINLIKKYSEVDIEKINIKTPPKNTKPALSTQL